MAGVPGSLGGPGGSEVRQLFLWQVMAQLIAVLAQPAFNELSRAVNRATKTVPLTPADLASLVVRNGIDPEVGQIYAEESGINADDFRRLVHMAGESLGPQELATALRRKLIPEGGTGPDAVSFLQGIAEGRLANKWSEVVKGLATLEPSPVDALQALLEGQIDEATAKDLYTRFGGDLEHFTWLYNTRGTAPSPEQLVDMANRGVIPWEGTGPDATSFAQGMLEGSSRNKWADAYRRASEWRPTVREISAMVAKGSISDADALQLYAQVGATPEAAAQQLADAHSTKTESERDLAVATIKALYLDGLIDAGQVAELLGLLRYSASSIGFYTALWDFEGLQSKVRTSVSKIRSLYTAHKIDAAAAQQALRGFGLPEVGVQSNLQLWTLERDANVATLTAAQICDAVYYKIIDIPEGQKRLEQLGWPPDEATIRIAIRLHGLPDNTPAGG